MSLKKQFVENSLLSGYCAKCYCGVCGHPYGSKTCKYIQNPAAFGEFNIDKYRKVLLGEEYAEQLYFAMEE